MAGILDISDAILEEIAANLEVTDLARLWSTCTVLHSASAARDSIWARLYERDFGRAEFEAARRQSHKSWRLRYLQFRSVVGFFSADAARQCSLEATTVRGVVVAHKDFPAPADSVRFAEDSRSHLRGASLAKLALDGRVRYVQFAPAADGFSVEYVVPISVIRHDVVSACLPADGARWGILFADPQFADFNKLGMRRGSRSLPLVVAWTPSSASIRSRMQVCAQNHAIKRALLAADVRELQATSSDEVGFIDVMRKLRRGLDRSAPIIDDDAPSVERHVNATLTDELDEFGVALPAGSSSEPMTHEDAMFGAVSWAPRGSESAAHRPHKRAAPPQPSALTCLPEGVKVPKRPKLYADTQGKQGKQGQEDCASGSGQAADAASQAPQSVVNPEQLAAQVQVSRGRSWMQRVKAAKSSPEPDP
eukprot:m51a1_g11680 hypothetical protein (422) ;mRNA; r:5876-7641